MTNRKKSIWKDELKNDDSYVELNLHVLSLSMGSSGNWLDYCHGAEDGCLITFDLKMSFDSHPDYNIHWDFGYSTCVYANWHESVSHADWSCLYCIIYGP